MRINIQDPMKEEAAEMLKRMLVKPLTEGDLAILDRRLGDLNRRFLPSSQKMKTKQDA